MKLPFIFDKEEDFSFCDELQNESSDQAIRGLSDLYCPEAPGPQDGSDTSEQLYVRDIADVLLDMGRLTTSQYEQLRQKQSAKIHPCCSKTSSSCPPGAGKYARNYIYCVKIGAGYL